MDQTTNTQSQQVQDFKQLLDEQTMRLPKVGDVVAGIVLTIAKNEVQVDIGGIATGVARGFELIDESGEYSHLKLGDEVSATVMDTDNEHGLIELSFRSAGHKKAWDKLKALMDSGEITKIKVVDANKGGLMIRWGNVAGFMPVSQLCPEHYPRIQGGDKNKILERLRSYIGTEFDSKVIDVNADDDKLIVSEKAAWEESQRDIIGSYNLGDVIEGVVTVITDFGVFVEFGKGLEGLVHISELAWQRIDDPKDVVAPGQSIKAEIIKIEGSKIFLSMKKLVEDPWTNVGKRYNVGDRVKGKILKVNPFGFFVELDPEIHGLAHISELTDKQGVTPHELAKAGDLMEFTVVSIEPKEHRLGLSLKRKKVAAEGQTEKPEEKAAEPTPSPEAAPAEAAEEPTKE